MQLRAIIRGEPESFVTAAIGSEVLVKFGLVIIKQRIVTVRPFAVGPALGIHLQEAEVNAKLDFFFAVFALEFPDDNLAGLVSPMLEEWRDIKVHGANMTAK